MAKNDEMNIFTVILIMVVVLLLMYIIIPPPQNNFKNKTSEEDFLRYDFCVNKTGYASVIVNFWSLGDVYDESKASAYAGECIYEIKTIRYSIPFDIHEFKDFVKAKYGKGK